MTTRVPMNIVAGIRDALTAASTAEMNLSERLRMRDSITHADMRLLERLRSAITSLRVALMECD